ncbi:MarR family winged helix-turn-helix transcriptional regulator [Pseudonocardia sp.]|uniref:MarR family winged helix-turn-helix transcriptional regulator n=1 Tax=Pseudonocardia sp. TaxID=60912 RepID=UPI003D106EAF
MADEPPDLDQRLVDAIERVGDAARAMLRRAAAAEGLTPTQTQLLLRITSDTAPAQGTGTLASWLEVTAPTVSDAVQALARKGLAERVPDATEPRRRVWSATPAGLQAAARLRGWRDPLLTALGDQRDGAKAGALSLLLTTIAALNARGLISTARTCLTCRFFSGEPDGEAWCALLETPLVPATLRVDCPEHCPVSSA